MRYTTSRESTNKGSTRREFLRDALAAGSALAVPYVIPGSTLGADDGPAPSERITMGCIGLGGRGTVNMNTFLGNSEVQIVALCDVDAGSTRYEDAWHRGLAPAKENVEGHYAARKSAGKFGGVDGFFEAVDVLVVELAGDGVGESVFAAVGEAVRGRVAPAGRGVVDDLGDQGQAP